MIPAPIRRAGQLRAENGRPSTNLQIARTAVPGTGIISVFENLCDECQTLHDFERDCMAIATSAPMNMAGNSWPTIASAIASDRAYGFNTLISLPTVVSVPKLKYVSFAVI